MKVVTVPVREKPVEKEMTFEEIQKFVGDDVQPLHLYDNIVALVDENARLKYGSKINRTVILQDKSPLPIILLNNFVLVKKGAEDFVSMDEDEIKEGLYIFRSTSQDATIFI